MSLSDYEVADSSDVSGERPQPEPGTYHVAVCGVNMEPTKKSGELVEAIRLDLQILDGTTPGQKGRKFWQDFKHPSPAHSDGGQFAAKMLSRLAYICGVGAAGRKLSEIDWPAIEAAHFVAEVKHREYTTDKGEERSIAEINGMRFWHVAELQVDDVPKNVETLELVDMGADPFAKNGAEAPKPKGAARPKANGKPTKAAGAPAAKEGSPPPAAKTDPYADL